VSKIKERNSFTLFELILVIVIIGVVYTLFIQNIDKLQRTQSIGIEQLSEHLKTFQDKNEVSLICIDECKKCEIYVDKNATKQYLELFKEEVISYEVDKDGQLEKRKYLPIYDEREEIEVCLKFTLFKNGSVSETILEYNEDIYYFPTYFGKMQKFETLDGLKEYFQERLRLAREL